MFELMDTCGDSAEIKVIGVGGGGGNAVQHMVETAIDGVDFICANTDAQHLSSLGVRTLLQLGNSVTKGLGAGANPDVGKQAAMEDRDRLQEVLQGADMVFITAGMGGGTGTGGAPVVAQVAREMGILTVAVVTKPFPFEGKRRMGVAMRGIDELGQHVDSLITIPNEKLLSVLGRQMTLMDAFRVANEVLRGAVQGIAELITRPGYINVDFADVRTVMSEMGMAMMGTGTAAGESRARDAAEAAINSPLLENVNLAGARGLLVNVTAGPTLSVGEFDEVGGIVQELAAEDANVVVGTVIDPNMEEDLRVTIVATGIAERRPMQKPKETARPVRLVSRQVVGGDAPVETEEREAATSSRGESNAGYRSEPNAPEQRVAASGSAGFSKNLNYLDIPAFLRRQAD